MVQKVINKVAILVLLCFFCSTSTLSQVISQRDTLPYYGNALNNLEQLLINNGSFKDAVFLVENSYFQNKLIQQDFDKYINDLVSLCKAWKSANPLNEYKYSDSTNFFNNYAIYKALKDSLTVNFGDQELRTVPFYYDFADYFGTERWSSMFVSKLLVTHKGNCHSLPFLYKILADELNASCWLSLAPNHIYVKNRSKGFGWYNTELTSGQFPIDAWITASGYIPLKAVQTGLYMDTLSNQQAIALCVLDLAKGYEYQTKDYYNGFILECCELVLKYHSVNPQALLLKAETLKKIYEKKKLENSNDAKELYDEMEKTYIQLHDLGYREMPVKMYVQWLASITKDKSKFENTQMLQIIELPKDGPSKKVSSFKTF